MKFDPSHSAIKTALTSARDARADVSDPTRFGAIRTFGEMLSDAIGAYASRPRRTGIRDAENQQVYLQILWDLGAITEDEYNDLDLLREVGNMGAHGKPIYPRKRKAALDTFDRLARQVEAAVFSRAQRQTETPRPTPPRPATTQSPSPGTAVPVPPRPIRPVTPPTAQADAMKRRTPHEEASRAKKWSYENAFGIAYYGTISLCVLMWFIVIYESYKKSIIEAILGGIMSPIAIAVLAIPIFISVFCLAGLYIIAHNISVQFNKYGKIQAILFLVLTCCIILPIYQTANRYGLLGPSSEVNKRYEFIVRSLDGQVLTKKVRFPDGPGSVNLTLASKDGKLTLKSMSKGFYCLFELQPVRLNEQYLEMKAELLDGTCRGIAASIFKLGPRVALELTMNEGKSPPLSVVFKAKAVAEDLNRVSQ